MRYLLQGCAILLWMTMAAHAAPLPLVVEGRSDYAIYHAADAPDSVKEAVAELREYIRKVTGASLPIVQQPREPMISLGMNDAARAGLRPGILEASASSRAAGISSFLDRTPLGTSERRRVARAPAPATARLPGECLGIRWRCRPSWRLRAAGHLGYRPEMDRTDALLSTGACPTPRKGAPRCSSGGPGSAWGGASP